MYDVAIIGCGPAGLMAAVYTSRAQLKTVIFGDYKKGNLYKSHVIANFLGFPDSITGPELAAKGVEHAKKFGAEILSNEIVDININEDGTFTLKTEQQKDFQTKTVIIATGQSYALSGIKNEQELTGKGVSYCVICDGFFFRNKNVVVVGSGNYAAEEALQLMNYTKNVTVLSHGKDFAFSPEMQKEVEAAGIKMQKTARIKEITDSLGNAVPLKAEKIIFTDGPEMATEGVFMAVGVAGATAFAKKLGMEMTNNYIKVDFEGKTNIPGLFAAGDCTGSPAQVASSVGAGCNAALSAIKLLRGSKVYIQYN
ncbi:MAG: NAD(P)/FAD-dependent oxidoreductase [Candidatus Gracilibacteria bacterium]|jgi:thioredoxin reductase (NADPH)